MLQKLEIEFARVAEALAVARAHRLSSRKTLLAAVLLDNFCDRAFEALRRSSPSRIFDAEDVLAFRERLRAEEPALGLIFDLCASAPGGPRLEIRAVAVPIEEYGRLSIEDYMVSLYNDNTVQRVVIAAGDGSMQLAHEVLGKAMAYLSKNVLAGNLME
ncbi:hypothetical protein GCM10007874_22550 [Labrys miyagiensis]|uniref:Uncharacterized protein n=1 Tax=Labrys miyagiensis TaxID=346912 RepID=A0ABQ6CHP1_9HYPH|nr:hypothetical protein [Labrys miyagiensis]GLS19238.1 hypothetical protein GCM10007874_22550 [Labrys miyagiensis]